MTKAEIKHNTIYMSTPVSTPLITISYQKHKTIIKRLLNQESFINIAFSFGHDIDDFKQSMLHYKIDEKLWHLSGINQIKNKVVKNLELISDMDKRVSQQMKFLSLYDIEKIGDDIQHTINII